jgi:hypothetical protein
VGTVCTDYEQPGERWLCECVSILGRDFALYMLTIATGFSSVECVMG